MNKLRVTSPGVDHRAFWKLARCQKEMREQSRSVEADRDRVEANVVIPARELVVEKSDMNPRWPLLQEVGF